MFNLGNLTEAEWAFLCQLIESELSELPVEIRHTHNAEMRADLQQRMKIAHELLDRMHEMAAV